MVSDFIKIRKCKKIPLGRFPTPLIFKENNFSIKRDDLNGYGRSGIKTRKLETFLSYFLEKGYTDMVLIVPNISNLRSDLELFAVHSKLNIHFIISNKPSLSFEKRKKLIPEPPNKNISYSMAGSKFSVIARFIAKYFQLFFSNKKVAAILPSCMHPSSVIGAANGFLELFEQYENLKTRFPSDIYISACTGTSAAGLLLANLILKEQKLINTRIHIAQTYPGNLKQWIRLLLWWTKLKYHLKVKIGFDDIVIYKKLEPSYGCTNDELKQLCDEAKVKFDLSLDPIYGARSFSVLIQQLAYKSEKDKLLFWHCGFTPDWNFVKEPL